MNATWPLLALCVLCVPAHAFDADDPLSTLSHVARPEPGVITAGRIVADDVGVIAAAGVRHVIDLSLDSETPGFDEARAVREAGMRYHALPVDGAPGLTRERVAQFDALLQGTGGESTLVHCSSSNRVGALAALRAAWIQGVSPEDAIELGRRWGLKGLEPAVRELLQAGLSDPPG